MLIDRWTPHFSWRQSVWIWESLRVVIWISCCKCICCQPGNYTLPGYEEKQKLTKKDLYQLCYLNAHVLICILTCGHSVKWFKCRINLARRLLCRTSNSFFNSIIEHNFETWVLTLCVLYGFHQLLVRLRTNQMWHTREIKITAYNNHVNNLSLRQP